MTADRQQVSAAAGRAASPYSVRTNACTEIRAIDGAGRRPTQTRNKPQIKTSFWEFKYEEMQKEIKLRVFSA